MKKFLFIINPVSGKGATKDMIPVIKKLMKDYDMDMKISRSPGDATKIAKAYKEKYTDIISVGGDGTLTEIVDGLAGFEGNLGIIPAGTGNDFARTIELPSAIETCLDIIIQGKTRAVDIPTVNNSRFINVASFGIDSGVIIDTDKIKKKITGTTAYVLSALKNIMQFKPYRVTMEIDDMTVSEEVVIVAVGNGKYFGGGMKVTPNAEIDDGLLDVVIARKTKKSKLVQLFTKLFKGTHMSDPIVEHYKCKKFSIMSSDEIFINTDGNLIGKVPAQIEVGNDKINVIIP